MLDPPQVPPVDLGLPAGRRFKPPHGHRAGGLALGLQVGFENRVAAGVALLTQLAQQDHGIPHPGAQALVDEGLVRIQLAGPRRARPIAGRSRLEKPLTDRLPIKPGEPSDVGDREALPVHGANLVHVPTSQQSGHLLLAKDLVTPILLRWGLLLRRCREFSTGHDNSGAGVLLPAIRDRMTRAVRGYVFVDAVIPEDGKSRLDLMERESRDAADQFRQRARARCIAPWTEEDLRKSIPDPTLRRQFVAELHPVLLAVYEEPIPVFEGWLDGPCGYLLFSSIYRVFADRAQRAGWPYVGVPGGHFHMLVDPVAVTGALPKLVQKMGVDLGR